MVIYDQLVKQVQHRLLFLIYIYTLERHVHTLGVGV